MKIICVILFIFLLFAGCDFYPDYPTDVSASDGEFIDIIELSWSEINYPEDEETPLEVLHYIIERSKYDNLSYSELTTTEDLFYEDPDIVEGIIYYYRVSAVFEDFTQSDPSDEDSGFALESTDLLIGDSQREQFSLATSDTGEGNYTWFRFMAQEGWTYTFETYRNILSVDTFIRLYMHPEIDVSIGQDDDSGDEGTFSKCIWECPESGDYYLQIEALQNDSFKLSAWHG